MDDATHDLVYACIATRNEEVLIELINSLKKENIDLAKLYTFGEYQKESTHEDVLNYVTYHT